MSWIRDNLFNVLSSALGFGTFGANQINQNKQNRFNAEQAQLNRNFQAEQAQLARDWQEDFYNTYQSPSAMVRQYQDAGLNPALLAGGMNIDSPPSTQTPSGSMASGTTPNYQSVADLVNMVGQMAMLKSEIDKNKSIAELNRASAFNQERQGLYANASSALAYQQIRLSKKQMSQIEENINFLRERSVSEVQQRNLRVLEMAFHKANNQQISLKNAISSEFERVTGFKADAQTINTILFSASNVLGGLSNIIGSTFSGLSSLIRPKQGNLKIPKLAEVTGNVK